jgi:hypothetical protein
MTSDRVSRHRARQAKLEVLREHRSETSPYRVPADALSDPECMKSDCDVLAEFSKQQKEEIHSASVTVAVSLEDVNELLGGIRSRWGKHQVDLLLSNCRSSVLSSIAGPFMLGGVVAKFDKDGGNVTTSHNAKLGVYANPEDEKFDEGHYRGSAYEKSRDDYKDRQEIGHSGLVIDEYSGKLINKADADCDHIGAVKEMHTDGGFLLAKEERAAFGADQSNFALTHKSGNRSMRENPINEWHNKAASDGSGRTNKERFDHDNRRVKPRLERAQRVQEQHLSATKVITRTGAKLLTTGATEGAKMGLQQSLGLLLTEFFSASFDEIADVYKNGFRDSLNNQSFFPALKVRLIRIGERVAGKWKDALSAFGDGFISGLLSNLATWIINQLVKTGKQVVRLIREGFMSILKAVKLFIFPPENLSPAEAADAALKLMATGVITSLGIMAEEAIRASLVSIFPVLEPIASLVSAVFVGAMTGIASSLLVYGIDQLDIFGGECAKATRIRASGIG